MGNLPLLAREIAQFQRSIDCYLITIGGNEESARQEFSALAVRFLRGDLPLPTVSLGLY